MYHNGYGREMFVSETLPQTCKRPQLWGFVFSRQWHHFKRLQQLKIQNYKNCNQNLLVEMSDQNKREWL